MHYLVHRVCEVCAPRIILIIMTSTISSGHDYSGEQTAKILDTSCVPSLLMVCYILFKYYFNKKYPTLPFKHQGRGRSLSISIRIISVHYIPRNVVQWIEIIPYYGHTPINTILDIYETEMK